MRDPIIGDLSYIDGYWERSYSLSMFGKQRPLRLLISCWGDEDILECQRQAVEEFERSKESLLPDAESAILEHYFRAAAEIRARSGPEHSAKYAPEIVAADGLAEHVLPIELLIKRPQDGETRIVGLLCDCNWDADNGVAVRFENEKIVEVGPQDIVL